MSIRRKILAVAGVGGVAAGMWMATPAQAEVGAMNNVGTYHNADGEVVSILPRGLRAGDCYMAGNGTLRGNASAIYLTKPEEGYSSFYWDMTMGTVHTYTKDLWHATYTYKNAAGATVLTVKIDGYPMSDDRVYRVRKYYIGAVRISQAAFDSIKSVDWRGDC
ncbi:hypothetical protein J5X84_15785 [Streptosporangiaceae bacterium NEAU-GS5]|nr:hypothetical protein [Streptosporangiaceae bacterium NEAU-GS5]